MYPRSGFPSMANMRTYPRSGFRSGGTSECTLVPVFVPGEHPPKAPFWKTTLSFNPNRVRGSLPHEKAENAENSENADSKNAENADDWP